MWSPYTCVTALPYWRTFRYPLTSMPKRIVDVADSGSVCRVPAMSVAGHVFTPCIATSVICMQCLQHDGELRPFLLSWLIPCWQAREPAACCQTNPLQMRVVFCAISAASKCLDHKLCRSVRNSLLLWCHAMCGLSTLHLQASTQQHAAAGHGSSQGSHAGHHRAAGWNKQQEQHCRCV